MVDPRPVCAACGQPILPRESAIVRDGKMLHLKCFLVCKRCGKPIEEGGGWVKEADGLLHPACMVGTRRPPPPA